MFARSGQPFSAPCTGVEHGDRGVEVVEARVDEVQRDDLTAEDLADLAVAVAGGAEPVPARITSPTSRSRPRPR